MARVAVDIIEEEGFNGTIWAHWGPYVPMRTAIQSKPKRRIKVDLDPIVAEILDLIAERIETELVPRPTRTALLDKAGHMFIERWLALHSEDKTAVDAIRTKLSGPKKVVRLAMSSPKESRGTHSEGEEVL